MNLVRNGLVFGFLFISIGSWSQDQAEKKEIYFGLSDTYRVTDTVIVFLESPLNLGIQKGMLINAYQAGSPGSRQKNLKQIGSGRIVKTDSLIMAFVKLFQPGDTLAEGDLASIELNVPHLSYRGVFSRLSFYHIFFTDQASNPFYSLENIFSGDSRENEESICNGMVGELHTLYQQLKDSTANKPSLSEKAIHGRYKGRSELEVLQDATKNDVMAFLTYVADMNSKYAGTTDQFAESFTKWVQSNSPFGFSDIRTGLQPVYKSKTAFDKLLPAYKKDILDEHAVSNFSIMAESLPYAEGLQLLDFAETLASSVNDVDGNAAAHLSGAKVYQYRNNYQAAVAECDRATQFALIAKNKDLEMQALLRKVYCLNKNKNFSQALRWLAESEKKLTAYRTELGDALYQKYLQIRYQYEGIVHYTAGDYNQALKYYAKAIEINKAINSYDAIARNAAYYKLIGQVNNDQGRPNEALESFKKSATIYRRNFDTLNWALLQNEMGNSYYSLADYRESIAFSDSGFKKLTSLHDYDDAGYSKSIIGDCYWDLGRYDSAVMFHKQSIELWKQSNDISGQAESWQQIGGLYHESGLKNEALNAYDSSALLYRRLGDSVDLAEIYNKKGEVYLADGNYRTAVDFFNRARGFTSKTTVESLYDLGDAWEEIDTSKASFYYAACMRKSDSSENTSYSFSARLALAFLAYREKHIAQGNRLYEDCVTLSRELDIAAYYADCYQLKAERFYNETEIDSALVYYHKAFGIYDTVSKEDAIRQLNFIADLEIELGEFSQAADDYLTAAGIAKSTSNYLALGNVLQNTSFLYSLSGDFEKGLTNSDSAISILSRSGNILRVADAYVNRGSLLKGMGDYNQSVRSYLLADSIYRSQSADEYRHVVLNNIGDVYLEQNDYENAMSYFKKALQIQNGIVDQSYLLYKGNMAECLYDQKKYQEAEADFLEIIPVAKAKKLNRIVSGMQLGLGQLYYDQDLFSRAIEQFNEAKAYAMASGEKEKMVDALTYLGLINTRYGKSDSAKNNFRSAITVVEQYKLPGGWQPYYELGLLFYDQKKFDSAIINFQKAIDLLDKNTENLYGGTEAKKIFDNDPRKSDLYNKMVFAYYNTDNIKQAWAYANRSNIAGIKELSGSMSFSNDNEKNEALKKLVGYQQSKKKLETTAEKQTGENKERTLKKIEIVEADYTNFLQDVVEKYPDLGSYFARFNADEFYNYKGRLPNDMVVVLYLVNDKTLMIFTLTNEKLAVDTMTADIGNLVSSFISSARRPQTSTATGALHLRSEPTDEDDSTINIPFKEVSNTLYKLLITPVDDKINGKKRLCIIPTGIFSNLPFQCLGQKQPDSSFRFLIEDYGIFYTNKMKIFDNIHGNEDKSDLHSFAGFGVPDQTLHYNTMEVKQIGEIIGSDSTVYTDSRATESMAKFSLTHKKYIHFATHGVLNYSQEFSKSYLKFLPDKDTSNGNNGRLTIREIQSLPIQECDLVTLSACETAIGKELVKGWAISPANSFLERNVRSVIASLWKVDDEATSILMNEFYKNLDKGMDKVDALRLAQETLSNNPKYAHPFYWGAFVLYGDWR